MYKTPFIYLIIIVFSFFSCSKNVEKDDNVPVIEELKVFNSQDEEKYVFPIETDIKFHAKFSDDVALGSYRMEIHYAGDGHRHYHSSENAAKKATALEEWEFEVNGNLKGNSDSRTIVKTIEKEVKGAPYHAIVYVSDDAGNFGDFKIVNFFISRTDMPQIELSSPELEGLTVKPGEQLILSGSVTAPKGVTKLQLITRLADESIEQEIVNKFINYSGENSTEEFSETVTIPEGATLGEYRLLLLAADKAGNIGELNSIYDIVQ